MRLSLEHISVEGFWCKEFYLTFSWNLIPASVQYTFKYLTSHTLKEKSCNNNELLWVRQQTVVLSLANNSHNFKIVYLPCFIYYSYVQTRLHPLPHVYAFTEFLRKAKQVIYCAACWIVESYFHLNLPSSWSQKQQSRIFLLPSSSLKTPADTTVMLSGDPWSEVTGGLPPYGFMGKSKNLHSFTPPIPADQLINRALTPAVYLPLNTLLIRLPPPGRWFLAEEALEYSRMHINAKIRSTIQTV